MRKPERLDLCYVSENEGKQQSPNTHSWKEAAAAAEDFFADLRPPNLIAPRDEISRSGIPLTSI